MAIRPFLLHVISSLHFATGPTSAVIDLPIPRMKATAIPIVRGSSIRGALRDVRRRAASEEELLAVFGPEQNDVNAPAGALVVGDARLLAMPVHSFEGKSTWVTSPLLLSLALRDLGRQEEDGYPIPPEPEPPRAFVADRKFIEAGHVKLQDHYIPASLDDGQYAAARRWAKLLADIVFPNNEVFANRFAIVDYETMTCLLQTATQLHQHISIEQESRTAAKGRLWLKESLPTGTVLIGVIAADNSSSPAPSMNSREALNVALPKSGPDTVLQLGGKTSMGRGRCRMLPV